MLIAQIRDYLTIIIQQQDIRRDESGSRGGRCSKCGCCLTGNDPADIGLDHEDKFTVLGR